MILVKNLYLKYIREYYALYDVNLEVKDGETVALIGEENSGKTSFLRVLAKLEKFQKGEVYIKDISINKINYACDANVGYLPVCPVFLENKTVYQNFEYILKSQKVNKKDIGAKINQALIDFNIEALKDTKAGDLKRYEMYLVSIARLALRNLELILIDDIFSFLTDEENEKIIKLIKDQYFSKETTVLLATQKEEIAKELCKRKVYFENGVIVKEK